MCGISEILKHLELKKIKLLIIAPDLEPNSGPGGLDATVEKIKSIAKEQKIPLMFSLKRRKIGRTLLIKMPVSCVGILNYDGCSDIVSEVLVELNNERKRYREAFVL